MGKSEMKGKSWTVEEETELKTLVDAKTPMELMATKLKRKPTAIYAKCLRLGLTEKLDSIPSPVPLPKELPSVQETLQKLAAAMETASTPGLARGEVQRLQVVATLAKTYKEILVDFINYREIEAKLNDMEAKYATLLKGKTQDDAPKPNTAQVEEHSTNQPTNPESQPGKNPETQQ